LAYLVNPGVHNSAHKPVGHVFVLWITHIPQESLSFGVASLYIIGSGVAAFLEFVIINIMRVKTYDTYTCVTTRPFPGLRVATAKISLHLFSARISKEDLYRLPACTTPATTHCPLNVSPVVHHPTVKNLSQHILQCLSNCQS
jgi:hypothetical protein